MEQVVLDKETQAARDQSVEPLQRMIAAVQAHGSLRADIVFTDTGLLLIRLNRPLPGPFSRALTKPSPIASWTCYLPGYARTERNLPRCPDQP